MFYCPACHAPTKMPIGMGQNPRCGNMLSATESSKRDVETMQPAPVNESGERACMTECVPMDSIDALVPVFSKELADLQAKWMPFTSSLEINDSNAQFAKGMVVAAYVTLATRAAVAAVSARGMFDRNSWRMLEQSIEKRVKETLRQGLGVQGVVKGGDEQG